MGLVQWATQSCWCPAAEVAPWHLTVFARIWGAGVPRQWRLMDTCTSPSVTYGTNVLCITRKGTYKGFNCSYSSYLRGRLIGRPLRIVRGILTCMVDISISCPGSCWLVDTGTLNLCSQSDVLLITSKRLARKRVTECLLSSDVLIIPQQRLAGKWGSE